MLSFKGISLLNFPFADSEINKICLDANLIK